MRMSEMELSRAKPVSADGNSIDIGSILAFPVAVNAGKPLRRCLGDEQEIGLGSVVAIHLRPISPVAPESDDSPVRVGS